MVVAEEVIDEVGAREGAVVPGRVPAAPEGLDDDPPDTVWFSWEPVSSNVPEADRAVVVVAAVAVVEMEVEIEVEVEIESEAAVS